MKECERVSSFELLNVALNRAVRVGTSPGVRDLVPLIVMVSDLLASSLVDDGVRRDCESLAEFVWRRWVGLKRVSVVVRSPDIEGFDTVWDNLEGVTSEVLEGVIPVLDALSSSEGESVAVLDTVPSLVIVAFVREREPFPVGDGVGGIRGVRVGALEPVTLRLSEAVADIETSSVARDNVTDCDSDRDMDALPASGDAL